MDYSPIEIFEISNFCSKSSHAYNYKYSNHYNYHYDDHYLCNYNYNHRGN